MLRGRSEKLRWQQERAWASAAQPASCLSGWVLFACRRVRQGAGLRRGRPSGLARTSPHLQPTAGLAVQPGRTQAPFGYWGRRQAVARRWPGRPLFLAKPPRSPMSLVGRAAGRQHVGMRLLKTTAAQR